MAVPKGKVSKARRNKRRANWKLSVPNMVECPQCHEFKMPHKVCKVLRILQRQGSYKKS